MKIVHKAGAEADAICIKIVQYQWLARMNLFIFELQPVRMVQCVYVVHMLGWLVSV